MSPQETNAKPEIPSFIRPIKILVCGGRRYTNKAFMWDWLDLFSNSNEISHVINGFQRGADMLAHDWAVERGIQPVDCPANWKVHGTAAGPLRNRAMAALQPDLCIAFPGGNGTKSMTSIARANNIKVLEIAELFKEPVHAAGS